jgi:hypothetical protein
MFIVYVAQNARPSVHRRRDKYAGALFVGFAGD